MSDVVSPPGLTADVPDEVDRTGRIVVGIAVVAAIVWLIGLIRFRTWIATGDHAIFQLRLERMLAGHIPLDGAFSRFGAHHPGPAREWVVGIGYWLSGGRTAALPATAIVINWGFLAAAIVAAWRTGGRAMAVSASLVGALLVWGLASDVHSTWNPYLPVIAGFAAVWGCTAVIVDARRWVLPITAGSVLAQVHATGFLVGIAVVATTLVAVAVDSRRRSDLRRVAIAGAVAVLAWLGPLIDLVNGGGWNLTALARTADGPRIGIERAAGHVAQKVLPWSAWRGETRFATAPPEPPPTAPILVGVIVVAALGVAIWRTRRRSTRALAIVAVGVVVLSLASYSLLRGFEHMYLFAPLAGVLLAPLCVAVVELADRFSARLASMPMTGMVALLALLPAGASIRGWTDYETIQSSPFDRGLRGAIVAEIEPDRSYTIVARDMVGVSAEGDVALYIHQAGGDPRSMQFSLDLPRPRPGDPTFVVAMGATLDCLIGADERALIVAESSDIGLPVGVFLIAAGRTTEPATGPATEPAEAAVLCGIEIPVTVPTVTAARRVPAHDATT